MKLPSQNLIHHLLLLVVAVLTVSPLYATDEVELIPFGSSWRWHHPTNGADPGPTFQSTWMNAASSGFANIGTAPLGYGVSDWGAVAQDIGTPPSGSRHTAYFKTTFSVPSELNGQFFVQILCDDGAAIYIDGRPVGRFNFSAADSYTASASSLSDERRMQMVRLSVPPNPLPDPWLGPDQLVAGTHTIAVSVHNFDPTSSDLAFDLSLFFVPHGSDLPTVVAPDGRRFIAVYLPGTTWSRDEAADQAARWAVGGKLATVRSQADNTLVFNLIDKRRLWGVRRDAGGVTIYEGPLIGGLQLPSGIEPNGGWTWGDNTPVTYTSWAPGEPNEAVAGQDLMRYWSTGSRRETWDDEALTYRFASFIVELPPPPLVDLAITSLPSVADDEYSPGDEVPIDVELSNLSNFASAPTALKVSGGALSATVSVPAISAGAKRTQRVMLNIPSSHTDSYLWLRAEVDPDGIVADSNRRNNRSSIKLIHVLKPLPQKIHLDFDGRAPFFLAGRFALPGWTNSAHLPDDYRVKVAVRVKAIFANSGIENIEWVSQSGDDIASVYFCAHGSLYGVTRGADDWANLKRESHSIVYSVLSDPLFAWKSEDERATIDAETAAHELGHSFGLRHVSQIPSRDEIMADGGCSCASPIFSNNILQVIDESSSYTHNPRYHLLRFIEGVSRKKLIADGIMPGTYDDQGHQTWGLSSSGDQIALARVRVFISNDPDRPAIAILDKENVSINQALQQLSQMPSDIFIKIEGVTNQGSPITVRARDSGHAVEYFRISQAGDFEVAATMSEGSQVISGLIGNVAPPYCEIMFLGATGLTLRCSGHLEYSSNLVDWTKFGFVSQQQLLLPLTGEEMYYRCRNN